MLTKSGSLARSGRMHLMTTSFSNPPIPWSRHRKMSAIPPRAICPTTWNLPKVGLLTDGSPGRGTGALLQRSSVLAGAAFNARGSRRGHRANGPGGAGQARLPDWWAAGAEKGNGWKPYRDSWVCRLTLSSTYRGNTEHAAPGEGPPSRGRV